MRKTLRKNVFHIVFLFLFMMVACNGYNFVLHLESEFTSYLAISEEFIYCIGTQYADEFSIGLVCLVVGLSSLLLALYNFRFMHTKKAVNVYYSLGVRRQTLFAGKLVGCVVSQLLGVGVPFIVCGLYNSYLFGSSAMLWQANTYYALSMLAISLFPFAMTVFTMARTGSTIEGLVCGTVLSFTPTFLYYGSFLLADTLLAGSYFLSNVYGKDPSVVVEAEFGGRFAFLDFLYPVTNYDFGDATAATTLRSYPLPDWGYPILFLAAFVVCSVLAQLAFNKQKTENAGFLGTRPRLFAAVIFAAGTLLIPWVIYLFYDMRHTTASSVLLMLALSGVAFGLFVGVTAILLRSREKLKKYLPTGGVMAGALVLFMLVFVFGGFGYEKRIPDSEKIVKAGISFSSGQGAVGDNYYTYNGDNKYVYEESPVENHDRAFLQTILSEGSLYSADSFVFFEDAENIEIIRSIHSLLLQEPRNRHAGYSRSVVISYELANGGTLTRAYPEIPFEMMGEFKKLLNTQDYRDASAVFLKEMYNPKIMLFSKNMTLRSDISFCTQDYIKAETALFDAVVEDVLNGNMPMDFVSQTAPVGYLGIYCYDRQSGLAERVCYIDKASDYIILPVYTSMQKTMAVLQQYELLGYFNDISQPTAAYIYENPLQNANEAEKVAYRYALDALQFDGYVYDWHTGLNSEAVQPESQIVPPSATAVTDVEMIEKLMQNTTFSYFVDAPGYFVEFVYTDAYPYMIHSLLYIPADQMPAELK